MTVIPPVVRHMILCQEVRRDPLQPNSLSLERVITTIISRDDPPFPLHYPGLCVCLFLSGGRGKGNGSVAFRFADTDERVSGTAPRPLTFGPDPLAVEGVVFNVRDIRFRVPGLYVVQFLFNDHVLAQEYLTVR
jgi:hypothetical protein